MMNWITGCFALLTIIALVMGSFNTSSRLQKTDRIDNEDNYIDTDDVSGSSIHEKEWIPPSRAHYFSRRRWQRRHKSNTTHAPSQCNVVNGRRLPRSCYTGVFSSLYNKIYNQNKARVFVVSSEMRSIVDVCKQENLTKPQLLMVTDLISMEANTSRYREVLDLCNEVIDRKNLDEMKTLNTMIPVGPRLLNDIETSTKRGLHDVKRLKTFRKNMGNIAYNTILMSVNDSSQEDEDDEDNSDQDKIIITQNQNVVTENIIFKTVVVKNINQLLPSTVDHKDDVTSNTSFVNSNIISGILYTAVSKTLINRHIVPVITLRHLKVIEKYEHVPVFWKKINSTFGTWSTSGCEILKSSPNATTFQCNHLTNFALLVTGTTQSSSKNDFILSHITTVGLVLSIICEVISIAAIVYIRKMTMRRKLMLHLLSNLLLSHIVFVSLVEHANVTTAMCSIVSLCLSYWYTCSFMWMFNIGIHLVYCVTTRLISKRIKLLHFCLLGYGVPALLQILGLSYTKGEGYGTENHCWLSGDALWVFIVPIAIIIFFNFAIAAYVLRRMYGTKVVEEAANTVKAKKLLRALLVLTPSLGLTWLFGVFITIFPNNLALQYIFTVSCATQGLWTLICCIIMDKKVRL